MALIDPQRLKAQFEAFSKLPMLRQFGLLAGLAASVALGTAIVLWSQQPNYDLLFGGLSSKDAEQVTSALRRASIPYRVDPGTGAILVPAGDVYRARLKLAGDGLPKGTANPMSLLTKNQGAFGFSEFMQKVQYQQALQLELERTIASLDSVQSDRIHLAIPKQSVFIENSPRPTASVLVNLYQGRTLSSEQVQGIVHLVASSVPGLSAKNVTVVDQNGNLLTGNQSPTSPNGAALSTAQYDMARRLDRLYERRIKNILVPIVGSGGVRAQVDTSLDYSLIDTTSQTYNPKDQVVRSQQLTDNRRWGQIKQGAVPGALTNQPPPAGVPANQSVNQPGVTAVKPGTQPPLLQENKSSTQNYEIGQTIQHIQPAPGVVKRLSVAVVVDYQTAKGPKGTVISKPLSKQELTNITSLVKEAVGFNAARGDTVNVVNAPFKQAAALPAVGAPPIWQQAWVQQLAKEILGALGIALLVFGVLRPVMRSLAGTAAKGDGQTDEAEVDMAAREEAGELGEDRVSLSPRATAADAYETNLTAARQLTQADPKRVAQVVKAWMQEE
ncbi:flagellar basal-body MS-ring/collar protein FliF [Acidihalobacter ferrooxydans]|uniref:Flagellar M-ring protein n=1 Tax=Acidihalobacter ferrooxydans TaxID=1765967 RepID=A0A1P8UGP4_9GAMM|nr:flagellar basal-body MS-ring/collar protein FliF [Acidihalobacter ferrooxydans]APZ43002.1 flagellar M-ring protein FliF [Acidihalobacter ferrooxydans]